MYGILRQRGISTLIRNFTTISKPVPIYFNGTLLNKVQLKTTNRQFPAIGTCRSLKAGFCTVSEENEAEPTQETQPVDTRLRKIPVETSIRYLKSKAYQTTYGNEPVWVKYRRNFKGQYTPKTTRPSCIKDGRMKTGNPCPICRDEYLVLHYTNIDLLKQFIHPQTGEIYDSRKIHVCQKKLLDLEVAIKLAKLHGFLTFEVPFRHYDYKEYYPCLKE